MQCFTYVVTSKNATVVIQALVIDLLVLIRYYSTYGHVARLAEEIKKGADSVDGVEATIWQV